MKRNYYRTLYISEFQNGTYFVFSTFFESDSQKAENIGMPIIFAITQDLTPEVTMDQLKQSETIHYFYNTDILHNDDSDDKIPIIKPCWFKNRNPRASQDLCVLAMNHATKPYLISKQGNTFSGLEYGNIRHQPFVYRP